MTLSNTHAIVGLTSPPPRLKIKCPITKRRKEKSTTSLPFEMTMFQTYTSSFCLD